MHVKVHAQSTLRVNEEGLLMSDKNISVVICVIAVCAMLGVVAGKLTKGAEGRCYDACAGLDRHVERVTATECTCEGRDR